jgi:hypothetical protein
MPPRHIPLQPRADRGEQIHGAGRDKTAAMVYLPRRSAKSDSRVNSGACQTMNGEPAPAFTGTAPRMIPKTGHVKEAS